MAGKRTPGGKKPARKRKVDLKDLSSPRQELTDGQARAVKGESPKLKLRVSGRVHAKQAGW
jgi:hypothetical protein